MRLGICQQPRRFDLVTLGRVGMDLYAQQPGVALAQVQGFEKSLGGSPGNIAVGAQRLGAKTAIISRLSDDAVGQCVRDWLLAEGVDVSALSTDVTGARTSLAVAEQRAESCEVVIYRHQAADLALSIADVPRELIADTRLLLISGTALSQSPSREAALSAIEQAQAAGTTVALDLDYRPYSWRNAAEAGLYLRLAAAQSAWIFGNREEFAVLGAGERLSSIESWFFSHARPQCVFFKQGAEGSVVLRRGQLPLHQPRVEVEVRKPYGAGDAYAAAICAGLLAGLPLAEAVHRGAAAAAWVVAHVHCALSSPDTNTLNRFIDQHATTSEVV